MECKESDRIPIYNLLRAATSAGNRMKPEDVDSGLKSVMELLDDIKIDCPKVSSSYVRICYAYHSIYFVDLES